MVSYTSISIFTYHHKGALNLYTQAIKACLVGLLTCEGVSTP